MLPFKKLVLFITNLARKTLQLELNNFTTKLGEGHVTKQAFSKARKNLNSIVFNLFNQKFIEEIYTDNDYKTLKGYRVLAIDGSDFQLPSSDEIIKEYGCSKNQFGDVIPSATASTLFDVFNKFTLDAIIAPNNASERDLAIKHMENILRVNKQINFTKKDIFLFDRGYPSMHLLTTFFTEKKDFLMRCPISFISEVREVIKKGKIDQIIEIDVFKSSRDFNKNLRESFPELDKDAKFSLRIINHVLSSGEKEILITSLLDKKQFSPLELVSLYNRRWDTEENYKFHKTIAQIENFSGKSKLSVEQDFYATFFMCNVAILLSQEALEDIQEVLNSKDLTYSYAINKNIALGTLKDELIYAILSGENLSNFCERVKEKMAMSLVPIRKNRSFPRHKSEHRNYPTNTRDCL